MIYRFRILFLCVLGILSFMNFAYATSNNASHKVEKVEKDSKSKLYSTFDDVSQCPFHEKVDSGGATMKQFRVYRDCVFVVEKISLFCAQALFDIRQFKDLPAGHLEGSFTEYVFMMNNYQALCISR